MDEPAHKAEATSAKQPHVTQYTGLAETHPATMNPTPGPIRPKNTGAQAFNDAVASMKPGDIAQVPSPLVIAGVDSLDIRLVSVNENGVCVLEVLWVGIRFGTLTGKPKAMASWMFDPKVKK